MRHGIAMLAKLPCCCASLCCHGYSGVGERGQGRSATHLCKAISKSDATLGEVIAPKHAALFQSGALSPRPLFLFCCSHTRLRCILQTL